jgi:hypothetical protein
VAHSPTMGLYFVILTGVAQAPPDTKLAAYGAGSPCRLLRKLCSGSAMGSAGHLAGVVSAWTGDDARVSTARLSTGGGHSMPLRANEAATSSIKCSIGAPNGHDETGLAPVSALIPPRGCLAEPGRGKSPLISNCFSIHYGGMVSREGEDAQSPQLRVSPRCVLQSQPPNQGGLKKCSGMLNVLPYMVPVKS